VRQCRDTLLPVLQNIVAIQNEAFKIVGKVREEPGLDILAVDTWKHQFAENVNAAAKVGLLVDVCDADDDNNDRKPAAVPDCCQSSAPRV
jgi:hypothetical protein